MDKNPVSSPLFFLLRELGVLAVQFFSLDFKEVSGARPRLGPPYDYLATDGTRMNSILIRV
jgi:hypothetical protein